MSDEVDYGEISFWNGASFGFIKPDAVGDTIFFHVSELPPNQSVKRGDRVTYRTAPDQRHPQKLRAVQVQVR